MGGFTSGDPGIPCSKEGASDAPRLHQRFPYPHPKLNSRNHLEILYLEGLTSVNPGIEQGF